MNANVTQAVLETLETRSLLSAGNIDGSFGDHGLLLPKLPANSFLEDVAMQFDGKVIAVGHAGSGTAAKILVARLNVDGSFDKTFAGTGIFTKDVSSGFDGGFSIALQTDGKIVVAGEASGKFAVLRLKTDGNLDTAFSGDGIMTFGTQARANDVAIQSNGKLVIAGFGNGGMTAARLTTSGAL